MTGSGQLVFRYKTKISVRAYCFQGFYNCSYSNCWRVRYLLKVKMLQQCIAVFITLSLQSQEP